MNWYDVCKLNEVPEMGARTVRADGVEIGLFRLSSGQVLAVENRCPHQEGPLTEGIVSGEIVICPLHSWKIGLKDGKVLPPDSGCVKTYSVKVRNEKVWIEL